MPGMQVIACLLTLVILSADELNDPLNGNAKEPRKYGARRRQNSREARLEIEEVDEQSYLFKVIILKPKARLSTFIRFTFSKRKIKNVIINTVSNLYFK